MDTLKEIDRATDSEFDLQSRATSIAMIEESSKYFSD